MYENIYLYIYYKIMKVIVTGGCGFIGSYVVESLIKRNIETYVIDIKDTWKINGAIYETLDILDKETLLKYFLTIKPNVCIHLAGILGTTETWNYIQDTVNVNINGANNVYEACGINNCNIVTVDVGSRWLSPYTITKTCSAEFALAIANKYNVKCGLLRIFNVYGPRQSTKIIKIAPIFIYKAMSDNVLEIWGNKNTDLIYASDVGEAFALAVINLDKINGRRDIYIGSGEQKTTAEFAKLIIRKINKGTIIHKGPRLGEEKIDSGYMNNNVSHELLEWIPQVKLDDGIDITIKYYKEMNIVENFKKF